MVGAARRSALAPTGSRIALMNELCQELNTIPLRDTMLRDTWRRPPFMAKVSWNRTWSEKMRKKSRGKKGKNRLRKKK